MFNLFKKKDSNAAKVIDHIWITEAAKLNAMAEQWKKNSNSVWICWFDDTLRRIEEKFATISSEAAPLLTAREVTAGHLDGKIVFFAEHHPMQEKEKQLFEKLHLKEAIVWSAMDEPLFKHFGADKIVQMMRQLGMQENEMIQHNLISKSIRNAQEKIADKVQVELSAHSQADWLQKNLRQAD